MRNRSPVPVLLLGALLLAGCAVGEDPTASSGGTGLEPNLGPAEKKDRRPVRSGKPDRKQRPDRSNDAPTPSVTREAETPSGGGGAGGGAKGSGGGGSTASEEQAPPRASVTDARDDVDGTGAPAFADVTGATLVRDGDAVRLSVEAAAAYPTGSEDRTMNVILFVDADGDGQVDYEVWGTLADNGWSGTWRHPDGAEFGSASGVRVSPSGTTLDFAFPAGHLGGADSFRWLVGAEHGTLEQQATGTMSSDYAPDSGAARFPG